MRTEFDQTSDTTLETAFEDYTSMAEGSAAPGCGVIARCPRCGALGRFTEAEGKKIYEHRRTSPEETRETCIF
jgi:hypothetical protein